MPRHKLIHLFALLAVVACAPTLGPSASSSTVTPRAVAALATSTVAPAAATVTVLSPVPPSPTPAATIATPRPTAAPLPTDAPVPQWGHQTKTSGCVVQGPFPDPACTPGDIFPNVTAA